MFTIESLDEVYALQKGLMELRYGSPDIDWAVQGSPILAGLHDRIVDSIIEHHEQVGDLEKAQSWREWRRFDTRVLERVAVRRFLASIWDGLGSSEEKREATTSQMRPFVFDSDDVSTMISEINEERSARR